SAVRRNTLLQFPYRSPLSRGSWSVIASRFHRGALAVGQGGHVWSAIRRSGIIDPGGAGDCGETSVNKQSLIVIVRALRCKNQSSCPEPRQITSNSHIPKIEALSMTTYCSSYLRRA